MLPYSHDLGLVPEQTAQLAHAALKADNFYRQLRDNFGLFAADADFAHLFSHTGRPAEAPWRLAFVTIFQFLEGLSDRQAAEALPARIDWKYALGLELGDSGFHYSVLCEFRARLLAGGAEELLLLRLLEHAKLRGLLKPRQRQRSDSTHVLAAIRTLSRIEMLGETLRAALEDLATVAPTWLRSWVPGAWFERYSERIESYHFPKQQAGRDELAKTIGLDGWRLLRMVAQAPEWLRRVPSVAVLRQMWLQQYVVMAGRLRLRTTEELPPSALRIASPYDVEARYSSKHSTNWVGYKVHLTETCERNSVHLITDVQTTAATVPDVAVTASIQAQLAQRKLLPGEQIMDGAYVDGELMLSSKARYGITLVSPLTADVSWQAAAGRGYAAVNFVVDWTQKRVTCPQGKQSKQWYAGQNRWGGRIYRAVFARAECHSCEARELCTRGQQGRSVSLQEQAAQAELTAGRQRQTSKQWRERYRVRAGVEGTISEGVRAHGLRESRYIGLAKTHLQQVFTAIAINLVRVVHWLVGEQQAQTRTSRFGRLAPAPC